MQTFRRYAYDCGVVWLAALVASSLVPLYLISLNPGEIGHFEFRPFSALSVLMALLFGALGMLVYGLLAALRRPSWARSFVLFVLFWTTITGFIYPVVRSGGMIDAAGLSINYVNVLIALVFTVALVRLAMSKQLSVLPFIFLALVMLFTLAPAVPHLSKASQAKSKTQVELLSLSSQENIVVLSFDGVPNNVVRKVFSQRPDLMEAFKDFVFFNEAISLAPATTASITAEMFGNRNYRDLGKTQNAVLEKLDFSTLPLNRAAEEGAATFTYGHVYNLFNLDDTKRLNTGDIDGGRQGHFLRATIFLEYAVARMATRYIVELLREIGLMRHVLAMLIDSDRSDPLLLRLLNHHGPRWDISYILEKLDFDAFVANMRVGRSGRYIAFMHFNHTHFPVDFDSSCEYQSDDKAWFVQNQSEAGLESEAICALSQAASFIDRLKALGVYDKTFLVVKSDHGQPATYFDEAPHSFRINRQPIFGGLNRYHALLLVKERGRLARRMQVVSERVTLGDLAPTMCRQLFPAGPTCNAFAGVNLVGPGEIPKDTAIFVDVVRDERSTYKFDTHMTVEIKRTADRPLAALLREARGVEISAAVEASQ